MGCFHRCLGGSNRDKIIILLERQDHTNSGKEDTCSFIYRLSLLFKNYEETWQEQLQDYVFDHKALNVCVKHIFFNGSPSEWTSDDQPVLKYQSSPTKIVGFVDRRDFINYFGKYTGSDLETALETQLLTKIKVDMVMMKTVPAFAKNGEQTPDDKDDNGIYTSENEEESSSTFEEKECDKYEKWTSDSMSSESARDKCSLDLIKHLTSKTTLEESDDEVPEIENGDFYSTEQIIYYTEKDRRLESFIAMPSCEVDPELSAEAGFFFTGELLVCFSCCVSFDDWKLEDPWMEHTIKSPGCAYVRSMKEQEHFRDVLTKLTEGKDERNSENNPDDAKSQKGLLVEKKYLDPPDFTTHTGINAGTVQGRKGNYTAQKFPGLGHLKLFDAIIGGKKPTVSLETLKFHSVVVKYLYEASIHEAKEDSTNRLTSKLKETLEFRRHLRELSWDTRNDIFIDLYMVPDVMSRLSSYNIWPHRNIRTGPLVEAGFSCKDPNTSTVECKSCGLELNASTLNGTTPMQYHREHSPDCEFFRQTNPQGLDGQGNRALTDSSHDQAPSPIGVNQEATHSPVQQSPGTNQQNKSGQAKAQAGKMSEANDTLVRTHHGNNEGNIRIDEATSTTNRQQTENASSLLSNNGAASFDSLVAERPRTEVFDRTAPTVPNNNNVTSSGEAVRENENIIAGAQGGEVPYQIRNPRYTEQNARRESYAHWPHRAAHDIDYLVNAGFFYTGAEDIVRCFYCDIGLAEWTQDDDAWVEHARHSPECPYLRNQKGQDYINNIQTQWARIYTPKHPQYAQMDTRRRSYQNAGWPRDNVLQTPEQLAAAGFFYTGDGDTVRCHYCDGGLREWEPTDDPWVEHARWFPFCKFVLKIKGIDFIQASATGNPANGLQAPVAPPAAPRINEAPLTLSFVDRCRIKEQKNPMHSAAAQSMRSMGYSRETIRMVIDKFIVQTGRRDFKAVDLMDIIMVEEEAGRILPVSDGEDDPEETGATADRAAAGGINAIDLDEEMDFSPAATRKENEYLKQTFKCKVCCQRERCIVFVPCGHRITCQRCGEEANTCPHCSSRIDQRFKTYLG